MDLSIIIVSWNTRDLLAQCLDSVYAHPPDCEFEVWVVDNASSDESGQMVRKRFPQVQLITNQLNIGFACASNQGFLRSKGKYLLLLNSDTQIQAGALGNMVAYLDTHMETGCVGVRLLNLDGTIQYYPTDLPNLTNQTVMLCHLPGRDKFLIGATDSSVPCQVQRVKGACLGIRREVIDRVGPMEESLFLYAEEDDLCQRIGSAGWKVVFLPDVVVMHGGGASTEQLGEEALLHLYRSKLWFIGKYHGRTQARLLKLVLALSYFIRSVVGILDQSANSRTRVRAYRHLLGALPLL